MVEITYVIFSVSRQEGSVLVYYLASRMLLGKGYECEKKV